MKLSDVLIKPILSEKANAQQDKLHRYAFRVSKKANKLEIKKAVEEFYGVTVVDVNTSTSPGKNKTRYTKAGFIPVRNLHSKKHS
jgi:large subunit ribosomal protein L23